MTLEDLLAEDSRRMALTHAPYNPLKDSDPEKIDALRCERDFEYWCATSCYIKNKAGGEDILFKLNAPQRKLVRKLESMRQEGKPIRLILLKARQWGGSTCVQIYMAWLQLIHMKGLNSLIIAHQHSATAEIKDMFVRMITQLPDPYSLKPAGPGALRVVERNCKVKVGSAERPDSCRGGDYSLVHCSEVALWRKTKLKTPEDMMRAATSGVLLRPLTMIVLESTANGTGNFFYDEYTAAINGKSQFTPLFISWFEIEQYSLPLDPQQRRELAEKLLSGKDNEQPLSKREQSGAYLWWLWEKGASLEAINWYISERAKYSDHGQMASEYPSDEVEAFVHSGARVFDKYRVEALRGGCENVAVRGEITGSYPSGPSSLENVRFHEDSQGALQVWAQPDNEPSEKIENRYLAVVDIGGRSLQADWSVVAVFDRAPMLHGGLPEVVAQWRGHSDFDLLAWNAARIARYYEDALLVIESNTLETHDRDRMVEGDQSHFLLNQLRDAYLNLYARKGSPEDIREGRPLKYGFHTNVSTKPMIIANLVKVVREGLYVERDKECLEEYLTYEQRQNGSYGAISGKHDDLLMTRAIGLHICFNEMEMPRRVLKSDSSYFYQNRRGSYASF